QRNLFSCDRILAQNFRAPPLTILSAVSVCICQRPCELAFRIIGTANKRAEFADFERQLPCAAGRAHARIGAEVLRRENMRSQEFVQTVEDLCGPQVLDARKRAGKIHPKLAQKLFPVELMVRYPVEVRFERCSKVIAYVAGKEAFQKSRHETTFVL